MLGRSKLETNCGLSGQLEPLDDLLARQLVGGRGQRDARHVRKALGDDGQADIFGPEIMAPLRDAMRLVDREQRHLRLRQHRQAARRHQPFRRDIEQVEIARDQAALDVGGLLERQRRVQRGGVDAGLEQAGDLVAHQRDQRRHDDAAAFAQQ